jgi:pimeloyl-ACP methyl ester carboxylesterase
LPEAARVTQSQELRHLLETEGGPAKGWKARSPLLLRALPASPTLILHGEADSVAPVRQAQGYAALFPAKARVALRLFPGEGHLLPIVGARDSVIDFLTTRLPPPPRQQP